MQFKKLAAMAGSAVMAGLTIAAPVLASSVTGLNQISDLVSVQDSTVSFPVFVVGAAAQTADVAGALNVAVDMAGQAFIEEEHTVSAAETVTGGVKFEQPGDVLVTGELITDILDSVGAADFPVMLGGGTFKTEYSGKAYAYNEYLDFGTDIAVEFENEAGDTDITPAFMMRVDDGDLFYNYSLEFPTDITYDSTYADNELEGAGITWLGSDWTILDVTESSGNITDITLISGKTAKTILLSTPETFDVDGNTYEITLIAVSTGDQATLDIDGVSVLIDSGVSETLADGTTVTVTDIFASTKESTPDSCKVYLGAKKVKLDEGEELEVDDTSIDGSLVDIITTNTSAGGELSGWIISYYPDDNVWLKEGETVTDIISGAFEFQYTGPTPALDDSDSWSTIEFKPDGSDRIKMIFTNKDGDEVDVPLIYDAGSSNTSWGYSSAKPLVLNEATAITDEDYFFVSTSNGYYTHLLQLKDVDSSDTEVQFKNIGSGSTFKESYTSGTGLGQIRLNNKVYNFNVTNATAGEIKVDMNGDANYTDNFTQGGTNYVYTEFGTYAAKMQFRDSYLGAGALNLTAGIVNITQALDEDSVGYSLWVQAGFDSDSDLEMKQPTNSSMNDGYGFSYTGGALLERSEDNYVGQTAYGTHLYYNSNTDKIVVSYPSFQVYHNLYVGSEISVTTGGDTIISKTPIDIKSDIVKLDTEITDAVKTTSDLVLVGGPCVNTLVAELADAGKFDYTCADWPGEDFGIVSVVDGAFADGFSALVIAGTTSADTDLAARVVQDGTKLADVTDASAKVTGTSLTDVVIS